LVAWSISALPDSDQSPHRTKTTPCANDRHPLFDHLIGGCEQRLPNAQTKRSRGGVMAADGAASQKLRKDSPVGSDLKIGNRDQTNST